MNEDTTPENCVTPEYLLSHGFIEYTENDENHSNIHKCPYWEDHRNFMEPEFHRQMFVIALGRYSGSGPEDETTYSWVLNVQEDAGCGFVEIPGNWYGLPIEYFEAIYFGIRGHKPKQLTPEQMAEIAAYNKLSITEKMEKLIGQLNKGYQP